MIEIMIVVALIGLLATIAIPNWVHARTHSQTQVCINNLRQIDGAKQQWAIETKQSPSATPSFADIAVYLKQSATCPAGSVTATFDDTYTMGTIAVKPTCKIDPKHVMPAEDASASVSN